MKKEFIKNILDFNSEKFENYIDKKIKRRFIKIWKRKKDLSTL